MKAEKFIKLVIDYEYIDISPNWVAFSISRTLEKTYQYEGIIDRESWNEFVLDPFQIFDDHKVIKHNIVMLNNDSLYSCPSFENMVANEDCLNIIEANNKFKYATCESPRPEGRGFCLK